MTIYTAQLIWDTEDRAWLVTIGDLDGAHTYGRSLSAAIANARESVEVTIDSDDFDLDVAIDPAGLDPAQVERLRAAIQARELRRQAQQLDADALELIRDATDSWSARELGTIVGLSHQRINQIATHISHPRAATAERIAQIHLVEHAS